MNRIKIGKIIAEKYISSNGNTYIRLKYNNHGTEVIMKEEEFEKMYGKFDG